MHILVHILHHWNECFCWEWGTNYRSRIGSEQIWENINFKMTGHSHYTPYLVFYPKCNTFYRNLYLLLQGWGPDSGETQPQSLAHYVKGHVINWKAQILESSQCCSSIVTAKTCSIYGCTKCGGRDGGFLSIWHPLLYTIWVTKLEKYHLGSVRHG